MRINKSNQGEPPGADLDREHRLATHKILGKEQRLFHKILYPNGGKTNKLVY